MQKKLALIMYYDAVWVLIPRATKPIQNNKRLESAEAHLPCLLRALAIVTGSKSISSTVLTFSMDRLT
jgi:hypothetical protein